MTNYEELEPEIKCHIMEASASGNIYSRVLEQTSNQDLAMSLFELSLLTGMMVHPASNFTTERSTSYVRMEWTQSYSI